MTDSDAQTKWCPFVPPNKQYDTEMRAVTNDRCLGSACMAWRRFLGTSTNEHATGGYCGLAERQ